MNYRHEYHAGGFSDVVKHIILIGLITSLKQKPAPFCYLDTHAGRAYYDLTANNPNKTQEYKNGIEKIIAKVDAAISPLVSFYLEEVHAINNALLKTTFSALQYYPGSTLFAQRLLRPQDRLIACELHREEFSALRSYHAGNKQVSIHHMDGFLGLKAHLPPKEKRGLILIDPPYEDVAEFNHIAHALEIVLKKWPQGIYAIWYPIKQKIALQPFYQRLKTLNENIFIIELSVYNEIGQHLNGCGIAIINMPWKFDILMQQTLKWLWNALSINNEGAYSAYFLK